MNRELTTRVWEDKQPRVAGETMTQLPLDLYIPADALAVWLAEFEGPLDLLLYLIRKNNIDILDIPIAEITAQYLEYIEVMRKSARVALAAEYLVMAAWLAEIKTRMLLPAPPVEEHDDQADADPRTQLIERLVEYERARRAADWLTEQPQRGRDWFATELALPSQQPLELNADLSALVQAAQALVERAELTRAHEIRREAISITDCMTRIRQRLSEQPRIRLSSLWRAEAGAIGVAVNVVAVAELARSGVLDFQQDSAFGDIWLWPMPEQTTGEHQRESDEVADE